MARQILKINYKKLFKFIFFNIQIIFNVKWGYILIYLVLCGGGLYCPQRSENCLVLRSWEAQGKASQTSNLAEQQMVCQDLSEIGGTDGLLPVDLGCHRHWERVGNRELKDEKFFFCRSREHLHQEKSILSVALHLASLSPSSLPF